VPPTNLRSIGRLIDMRDVMIAGTVVAHHGALPTRKTKHFVDTGIRLIGHWQSGPPKPRGLSYTPSSYGGGLNPGTVAAVDGEGLTEMHDGKGRRQSGERWNRRPVRGVGSDSTLSTTLNPVEWPRTVYRRR
jgi:hypothetical protein